MVAAITLAGCVASILMIIRASTMPPLSFLNVVAHPELERAEVMVAVAESTGQDLVVYGTDAGRVPERCTFGWIQELPSRPASPDTSRQELIGVSWLPLWESTGEVPPRGQEVFTTCFFDAEDDGMIGNFFVGPREVPPDTARDWYRAAIATGSATLAWVIVAGIVLVRRST